MARCGGPNRFGSVGASHQHFNLIGFDVCVFDSSFESDSAHGDIGFFLTRNPPLTNTCPLQNPFVTGGYHFF